MTPLNYTLTISRIQYKTRVLGPGIRAVIWFHGCSHHCPGCVATEMNASSDYRTCTVDKLLEEVLSIQGIEGITLSGGEPFEQNDKALFAFLSGVKKSGQLSVMVYTGYMLDDLITDSCKSKILDFVDILVDGPYVESDDHGELWRGSGNQTIYFLTSRYLELAETIPLQKGRPMEFSIGNDNRFSFVGIPPKGFRKNLEKKLGNKGLTISWHEHK